MVANVDTMAYAGDTPWHGLGQALTVEDTTSVEKVREKSGVIWNVSESPIFTRAVVEQENDVQFEQAEGFKALRRSDNGNVLSIVTNDYNVVQPEEIFNFYKHFVDNYGFRLHTAGSLAGGKKVWVMADVGKEFTLHGNDTVGAHLLLVTSFDKSLATICKLTSVRVVCQNTLNISLNDGAKLIKVPHSAKFDASQVTLDVEAMGRGITTFHEQAKVLSERIVSRDEIVKYFLSVFYPKVTSVDEMGTRQKNTMGTLIQLFESGKGQREAGTTAWGLVNATTLYIDHNKGRSRDTALHSAWFGVGETLKDNGFKEALKLVA